MSSSADDTPSPSAPCSPVTPGPDRPVRALVTDRSFLCVWLAGGLTGIVRWLQLLVLGIYTYQLTGSPLLVSIVPMLWMLPLAVCGPAVGVIADRVDRKWLLGTALLVMTGVYMLTAWVTLSGALGFMHVVVVSIVSGLFWATDMPIRRRLLGDLSGERLSTAMALDSATGNATRMAGPLLGGVMLEMFSLFGVFVLSAIVFALCLILVLLTRLPRRENVTTSSIFVHELSAGVRFVLASPKLRRIFAITIVFNIWGFPFTSMIPVIGTSTLGLNPFMVGVLSSTEGLGAFVGAIVVALLARPQLFFFIYAGGTTLYLIMVGYLGVLSVVAGGPTHSFVAMSATLMVLGMASACFAAMQGTLSYLAATPEYRSRVLGVLTLCIGSGPIGFFNIGWMAENFGVSMALMISSVEGLLALAVLWAFSSGPIAGSGSDDESPNPSPA